QRDRDTHDRAAPQELPPVDMAEDELVDNVVLDLAAPVAQLVELLRIAMHGHLPLESVRLSAAAVREMDGWVPAAAPGRARANLRRPGGEASHVRGQKSASPGPRRAGRRAGCWMADPVASSLA